MKILTLNFYFSNNYGGVLEAYALQQFLQLFSDDVVCLNFSFEECSLKRNIRRILKAIKTKEIRDRYFYKVKKVFLHESDCSCLSKSSNGDFQKNIDLAFDSFRNKFLKITTHEYHTFQELKKINADIVVCGSDIIWHVNNESLTDEVYFLSWVPDNVLKIAYAPSWGTSHIPYLNDWKKKKIQQYLSRFEAVSVREKSGVDICSFFGRRDAQWVPDPTMLLTAKDWNQIAEIKFHGTYILNYHIPYNESVNDTNVISIVSQYYNAPVKTVPDLNSEYVWISPTEWIGSIKNAEFVITNSFHGVVFCLIYNKKFLFTKLIGEHKMLNERIYSLLELFELHERILTEEIAANTDGIKSAIVSPIDWDKVNEKLKCWRQEGIDFLKKSLKKYKQNT